jgi:hypothetical protein
MYWETTQRVEESVMALPAGWPEDHLADWPDGRPYQGGRSQLHHHGAQEDSYRRQVCEWADENELADVDVAFRRPRREQVAKRLSPHDTWLIVGDLAHQPMDGCDQTVERLMLLRGVVHQDEPARLPELAELVYYRQDEVKAAFPAALHPRHDENQLTLIARAAPGLQRNATVLGHRPPGGALPVLYCAHRPSLVRRVGIGGRKYMESRVDDKNSTSSP